MAGCTLQEGSISISEPFPGTVASVDPTICPHRPSMGGTRWSRQFSIWNGSMRRTKAAQIYKTRKFTAVQLLLGHTKLESTLRYLGIGLMTRSAFRSKLSC